MKPLRKGWCPTLTRPMETGDGWLARLSIPQGIVSAAQARIIADLAKRYGNGHIDLTSRGNLQLRGITPEQYDPLISELAAHELAAPTTSHVLTNPLAGIDPACAADTQTVAAAVEKALVDVPAKFLCVIDGGGALSLASLPADMYFTAPFDTDSIIVRSRAQAMQGCDKKPSGTQIPEPGFVASCHVMGIGIPFGRLEYHMLISLAYLSDRFGNGTLRLAPWRMVFLPGIADAEAITAHAKAAGFITDGNDARLAIQCCPGVPACASAEGDTRQLAQQIADAFPKLTNTLHISGCAKGCACAAKTDTVITARSGAYDLAFNTIAGAPPVYASLTPEALIHTLEKHL